LIGIGVSGLGDAEGADPADLVNQRAQRSAAAEHAVDRLRGRFGDDAVIRGLVFGDGNGDDQDTS
jgi:DNA polymerase-4